MYSKPYTFSGQCVEAAVKACQEYQLYTVLTCQMYKN